ncbi:polysaccharide biosynthesis/export family protein [Verrucomicrobiota bacterium]
MKKTLFLYLAVSVILFSATGCSMFRRRNNLKHSGILQRTAKTPSVDKARNAAKTQPVDKAGKDEPKVEKKEFTLAPGYILNITVLVAGEKEIDEPNKRIQSDGKIILPLVGPVTAEGKTLIEFRRYLYLLYNKYFFVNPKVQVDYALASGRDAVSPWGCVTVLGRVKEPGKVNISATGSISLTRAIQKAGGFSTSAKKTAIRITRVGKDGRPEKLEINLQNIGAKGKADDDVMLYSGDIVFVPELIF